MRALFALSALALVAACSPVQPISDAEKAEIDCLASITVVEITDRISQGAADGTDPAVLSAVPAEKIAAALVKLEEKYSGRMDEAYLEYDINHRLDKIQDALNNRDPESEATKIMNETLELGRSCTFGS